MGSARPTPTPPRYKTPRMARGEHAEALVNWLMHEVRRLVLQPNEHEGRERECYEVSEALRDAELELMGAVESRIIGSARNDLGMKLSKKIVIVVSNELDTKLIRPGPTPEDRDSGDMWQEAWAMRPALTELVAAVIAVDDKARGI